MRFVLFTAARYQAAQALGVLAGVLLLSVGCKTASAPSRFVAPRIVGRVLDVTSQKPIPEVQVRRLTDDVSARSSDTPHGARLLENDPIARTGSDGAFQLKSVRALGLFGTYGWYSVSVAFQRNGYQSVVRSYTLTDSTNSPAGEPLIDTGEIFLVPAK